MRSTNFFSRGRTDRHGREGGFVIGAALLLALLYFALMELLLLDSSRALQDAQRFRAKIVAGTLAEDAAELAAAGMTTKYGNYATRDDAQGKLTGSYLRTGESFELTGTAESKGVTPTSAKVRLQGRIDGTTVIIDYSTHSQ